MGPDDVRPGAPGMAEGQPDMPLPGDISLLANRESTVVRGHRATGRSRPVMIGAAVLVALLVLGGIAVGIYKLSHKPGQGSGVSRLSLPGISVAAPRGWHELDLSADEHAVAAEPSLPCPDTLFGGPAACQDALTLASVPETSLRHALEHRAQIRFTAMRNDIQKTIVLHQGPAVYGGCPAYATLWRVRWVRSLVTIEELIVVKTGVRYADSDLESVFIRFADTPGPAPRAAIGAITSSIHCTP